MSIRLASMLYLIDSGEAHDIPVPDEVRSHLWQVAWFPDGEKLILTAESESDWGHTLAGFDFRRFLP